MITTLAVALVVGLLRGGGLADLRFRRPGWLLPALAALAAQVAVGSGLEPRPTLLAVAHLAPLGFLWANRGCGAWTWSPPGWR